MYALLLGKATSVLECPPRFDCDTVCLQGYVVLNRPWAFVQWLEKAKIEEE
jgi:hypothetical protein